MRITNNTAGPTQPSLALRRHSIRTLTSNEPRGVNGGYQASSHTYTQ